MGGIGLGYLYLGLVTLVGVWLTPFLLGRIGQHEYGLWLVTTQILGYLMLLDLGVVALLPRETAYATGRELQGETTTDLAGTIARFRRVVRWQVPLVAAVAVAAWVLLPADWQELRDPLLAILGVFVVTFPLRVYHAALQGLQDLAFLGRVQIVTWAAGTTVMVLAVLAGAGLGALAAGWILPQIGSSVACAVRLRRRFPHAWQPVLPQVPWAEARALLGRSGWISMSQVAQIFLSGTDVLVVGMLLGPAAVVPYACTGKLITVLANHPQLLMQSAQPALAEMRMAESHARLAEVAMALMRAMLILSGAVACVVLAVNKLFVSWWVGPDQFGGAALTFALLSAMLLRHLNTTLVYALFSFGHEKRLSLTALADGLLTLGVTFLLVSALGLLGAPLGSLAGVLLVAIPANFAALCRELGTGPAKLVRSLSGWVWRFSVAAGASMLLGAYTWPEGLTAVVAAPLLGGAIYFALMLPLALQPPLGSYIRRALHPLASMVAALRPVAPGPPV